MSKIVLENVTKKWGKFYAVDNLNLVIDDNAFVVLLGPSGCGKTTTLRMIAGLETPTSGKITIDGRVVFDSANGINIPPNKRKVGFLFQNYALWPNMTVYENISFGLSNIKEVMPKVDFETKSLLRLADIMENDYGNAVRALDCCRDKDGRIDRNIALIRLIDTFQISQFTAKRLLSYGLENNPDLTSKIVDLRKEAEMRIKQYRLNGKCEYTLDDGSVVMEKRRLSKEEIDLSVRRVARIVHIENFMDRYPAELSGGQQQRVAIARTLAPQPSVLFMDEPLSNLDAKLRLEMRYELQRLHIETGSTFVYVTHDQTEAMTLSTRICLINNGVLQQYEEPLEIYRKPANLFAADFVGNPSINFIDAKGGNKTDGSYGFTIFDSLRIRFVPSQMIDKSVDCIQSADKVNKDTVFEYNIAKVNEDAVEKKRLPSDYVIGVRPECVKIDSDSGSECVIYGSMPTGMETTIKAGVGNFLLTSVVFGDRKIDVGTKGHLSFSGDGIMLFDSKSGHLIALGKVEFQ